MCLEGDPEELKDIIEAIEETVDGLLANPETAPEPEERPRSATAQAAAPQWKAPHGEGKAKGGAPTQKAAPAWGSKKPSTRAAASSSAPAKAAAPSWVQPCPASCLHGDGLLPRAARLSAVLPPQGKKQSPASPSLDGDSPRSASPEVEAISDKRHSGTDAMPKPELDDGREDAASADHDPQHDDATKAHLLGSARHSVLPSPQHTEEEAEEVLARVEPHEPRDQQPRAYPAQRRHDMVAVPKGATQAQLEQLLRKVEAQFFATDMLLHGAECKLVRKGWQATGLACTGEPEPRLLGWRVCLNGRWMHTRKTRRWMTRRSGQLPSANSCGSAAASCQGSFSNCGDPQRTSLLSAMTCNAPLMRLSVTLSGCARVRHLVHAKPAVIACTPVWLAQVAAEKAREDKERAKEDRRAAADASQLRERMKELEASLVRQRKLQENVEVQAADMVEPGLGAAASEALSHMVEKHASFLAQLEAAVDVRTQLEQRLNDLLVRAERAEAAAEAAAHSQRGSATELQELRQALEAAKRGSTVAAERALADARRTIADLQRQLGEIEEEMEDRMQEMERIKAAAARDRSGAELRAKAAESTLADAQNEVAVLREQLAQTQASLEVRASVK